MCTLHCLCTLVGLCLQERARKLRIFLDETHPFEGHPDLVPWVPRLRNLRVGSEVLQGGLEVGRRAADEMMIPLAWRLQDKEVPEDLEPGEVLLNPAGYFKRYKHVLSDEQKALVQQQIEDDRSGIERLHPAKIVTAS